jgi:hypothetical protein
MEYRPLQKGDRVEIGDEAWTWTDPDCTSIGGLVISELLGTHGDVYDPKIMVPMRRPLDQSPTSDKEKL